MNFLISKLIITNYYLNSNFLKNNKEYFIKNSLFQNFFVNLIKTKKSFKFFNNKIYNFLSTSIIIENNLNNIYILRTILTKSINCTFINCIFINCSSGNRGGAIYGDNSNLIIIFNQCGFSRCYSTLSNDYTAGAISIYRSNSFKLFKSCFIFCSSNNDPSSYQIASQGGGIIETNINYTSESLCGNYKVNSVTGSMAGGNTLMKFYYNNITNTIVTNFASFMIITGGNDNIGGYSLISKCLTKGLIGFHATSTRNRIIENINFINNSIIDNAWIIGRSSNVNPTFNSCVFYEITSIKIMDSSGIPIFNNCYFDNSLLELNKIGTFNNCIYNSSYLNNFFLTNTYACWAKGSILIEFSIKKMNFYSIIYFINILIFFLRRLNLKKKKKKK